MARQPEFTGMTPIEAAIGLAIERQLRAERGRPEPRSAHPIAIAAQDRRRVARLAQATREQHEAARRRDHRLALENSMDAARIARAAEWGDD